MSYFRPGEGNDGVRLFYDDAGSGKPVVLIHGWPLSHEMWEYQTLALARQGCRVISYDRRGFGQSDQPWDGYDYDTLSDDLKALLDHLDLQDVTLVGFSMGGGEVARYISRHGGARVVRVVFVAAVTPFLLKTGDNPDGVDQSVFSGMIDGVEKDRADFLSGFGKMFYGTGMLSKAGVTNTSVSAAVLDWTQALALRGSLKATIDCVRSFSATDFRADIKAIRVPALIIHGDNDLTVPIAVSGERTAKLLPNAEFKIYRGAPHGLFLPEKDRLNSDLLTFVKS